MNVVNFYQVLQTKFDALQKRIGLTLHSRETYRKAMLIYESPWLFQDAPITRAWAFYVVTNQGFAHKV